MLLYTRKHLQVLCAGVSCFVPSSNCADFRTLVGEQCCALAAQFPQQGVDVSSFAQVVVFDSTKCIVDSASALGAKNQQHIHFPQSTSVTVPLQQYTHFSQHEH
jgi:hypothetical protein